MSPPRSGEELLHDAALMRSLLEAAPDAHVVVDEHGRIVLVNGRFEALFGYARDEVLEERVEMLLPERDRAGHGAHRSGFFADPRPRAMGAHLELHARRKDGSEFPVEISLSPIVSGSHRYASAAIRDATLRRKREEKFRGLLEAAPDAMVIVDREGRIVLVNQQTEIIFGYGRDELIGERVEALVPTRYRATHPPLREGYQASPRVRPMGHGLDLMARRKDGTEFPVEISLSPLETEEGAFVISAIRDVSEKRRSQRVEREQFVTRKLVRRMLRDTATKADQGPSRRQLGRDLGSEVEAREVSDCLEAFQAMGLGELAIVQNEGSRLVLEGQNLLEVTPGFRGATCQLALGFIEGAVGRRAGGEALGAETACQSQGHPRCTFVVHSRRNDNGG